MSQELEQARQNFVQGISRITNFWGFPKAMGAIYAAIYLSPEPMTLDELCKQVGVTKGAVSTNIRNLERLGVVHKQIVVGDRKDYYLAETDFWKALKGILREREKNEFDLAIRSVGQSLAMVEQAAHDKGEVELAGFYKARMTKLKGFFDTLDNLVATIIAIDDLRAGVIGTLFKK